MMDVADVNVFYSLQRVGSLGVFPSPINSAKEKEMAQAEAQQTVTLTWSDLRIVLFVCGDIDDVSIHQWMNFLKRASIGFEPEFSRSTYWEDSSGMGYEDEQ